MGEKKKVLLVLSTAVVMTLAGTGTASALPGPSTPRPDPGVVLRHGPPANAGGGQMMHPIDW